MQEYDTGVEGSRHQHAEDQEDAVDLQRRWQIGGRSYVLGHWLQIEPKRVHRGAVDLVDLSADLDRTDGPVLERKAPSVRCEIRHYDLTQGVQKALPRTRHQQEARSTTIGSLETARTSHSEITARAAIETAKGGRGRRKRALGGR